MHARALPQNNTLVRNNGQDVHKVKPALRLTSSVKATVTPNHSTRIVIVNTLFVFNDRRAGGTDNCPLYTNCFVSYRFRTAYPSDTRVFVVICVQASSVQSRLKLSIIF